MAESGTEPEISVLTVFAPLRICPSSLGHSESSVGELESHSFDVPLGHPGGRDCRICIMPKGIGNVMRKTVQGK